MTSAADAASLIVDTGPLVAPLNRRDAAHAGAARVLDDQPTPWATCEAVLTEAAHLLRHVPRAQPRLLDMLDRRLLRPTFRLDDSASRVNDLMRRIADVPMDFADACLVCMSEAAPRLSLATLDRDFLVYRRAEGDAPTLLSPFTST